MGVQNDPRGTGIKMSSKKILFDAVLIEKFDVQNRLFFSFFQKVEKWPFCFADFTMKTASPEKMEYTTRKPMENPTKLSTQIF